MIEFVLAIAPTESTIVRYFEKDLKFFIKTKINKDATQLENYEELVVKVIKSKVKRGLQRSFIYKRPIKIAFKEVGRPTLLHIRFKLKK